MLLLRPRPVSSSRAHPRPEDVLLAVEVADTTARYDRIVKAWLYRGRVDRGRELTALAFPDVVIRVDELFT